MTALGDHIKIISGYAFDSKKFNESQEGMPLIRIRDVGKKNTKTYYSGEYSDDYLVKSGDYLVGMDGDFRLAKWESEPALLNQRVCKIVVVSDKLDKNYLYRFLPTELKKIEESTSYATVKHLSTKKILGIQIPLPPLPIQQKIAAILDAADELRQKDKALVAKYDELAQALFLDMFGDPVSNPKGYQQKTLEELSSQITDGTHFTPNYTSEGISFLRVTDITGSNDSKKYISEKEHIELIKRCHPVKNDILYTKNGTIGVSKIVDWDYPFSIFVSLCLIKPKHDLVEVKYLNHFLNTPFALNQARSHSKEATIKNLHLVEIKKLKVLYPSIKEQRLFVVKLDAIEQQKRLALVSAHKSELLFKSLLQKAFNGDLT